MLRRTNREYILAHCAAYVVGCFGCFVTQAKFMKSKHSNLSTRKIYFQFMISVHLDDCITIRRIFTLPLCTISMDTSRTFSNVLEHFQKKSKNFLANLIFHTCAFCWKETCIALDTDAHN